MSGILVRRSLLSSVALVLALVLALPASAHAELPASATRTIDLLGELGGGLQAAGTDCDKAAAAITAWASKNSPEMQELAPKMDALQATLTEVQMKEIEGRLQVVMEQVVNTAMQCAGHAGVEQAFASLDQAMGSGQAAPPNAQPVEVGTIPADGKRAVELVVGLGTALDGTSADCAQVAKVVTTWNAAYGEEMRELSPKMETMMGAWTQAERAAIEVAIMPAAEKIAEAQMTCGEDEKAKKALEELNNILTGSAPKAPVPAK